MFVCLLVAATLGEYQHSLNCPGHSQTHPLTPPPAESRVNPIKPDLPNKVDVSLTPYIILYRTASRS